MEFNFKLLEINCDVYSKNFWLSICDVDNYGDFYSSLFSFEYNNGRILLDMFYIKGIFNVLKHRF